MLRKRDLSLITLNNIEKIIARYGFDFGLAQEILDVFQKRIERSGEDEFQAW